MTKRRKSFTLVELLVAVALLSLIVMLLLQLFGGAQRIWIASEKTNNVYANGRVAMELMADLLSTVQFSHGENADGNRDNTKDMIFWLDSSNKDGDYASNRVIFVTKTARDLPIKDNTTCFISFRLGDNGNEKTRGKLFMVIYSDKNSDFYNYFPIYKTYGNRLNALNSLKSQVNSLVTNYTNSTSSDGEKENCQVIAENVVAFKINAYVLGASGKLDKKADSTDIAEPPYMIELQLTVLDPDSYKRWLELDRDTAYLNQHKRTFTRGIHIGPRWDLEAQTSSGSGSGD